MKSCKISYIDLQILNELSKVDGGLKVEPLSKLIKIKERTVYYHLKKLVTKGMLFHDNPHYRIVKSIRESQEFAKLLKENKGFILGDLSLVVRIIRKPLYWDKRENNLRRVFRKAEVKKVELRNHSYIQIFEYDYYIQVFKDSLIFISTKKYAGLDPYECFISAVKDFVEVYNRFEESIGFKFFEEGIPNVTIKSQNYVRLRDAIAEHCKRTGDKFEVWVDGKKILYVDMSKPLGMESNDRNSAPDDIQVYSEYVADMETKKPPKLSEMAEMIMINQNQIKEVIEIQKVSAQKEEYYAENFKTHVGAIQELGQGINLFNERMNLFLHTVNDLKIMIEQFINRQ